MKINVRMLTAAALVALSAAAYLLLDDKGGGAAGDGNVDGSIELYDQVGSSAQGTPVPSSSQRKSESQQPRVMEMPAPLNGKKEILMKRTGYSVSYNKDTKLPNWVAWHLTAAHTKGRNYRDGLMFEEDGEVPSPRATDYDYSRSRYDRGHMCPSGDNKWDKNAQRQSFLLTNVCPQNHELNKGDWNDLEMQCREWAKQMGDIYVVAGPVFYNGVKKTIGRNKVAVPDAFFKVVMHDGRKAKAIGFIYPNAEGHKNMAEYVKSVDDVERITGLDFFPKLDDEVEDRIEAAGKNTSVKEWGVGRMNFDKHPDKYPDKFRSHRK